MKVTRTKNSTSIEFDLSKPPSLVSVVRSELDNLIAYRDDGRIPSPELLRDIRLYEYILRQPDPDTAARKYFETRHRDNGPPVDRSLVLQILGWEI